MPTDLTPTNGPASVNSALKHSFIKKLAANLYQRAAAKLPTDILTPLGTVILKYKVVHVNVAVDYRGAPSAAVDRK